MLLTCLEEPSYIVGPPLAGGLVARGRLAWWRVGGLFPRSRLAWWRVGGLFPRSWLAWWRVGGWPAPLVDLLPRTRSAGGARVACSLGPPAPRSRSACLRPCRLCKSECFSSASKQRQGYNCSHDSRQQRNRRGFVFRASRPGAIQFRQHLAAHPFQLDTQVFQYPGGDAFAFAYQPQQQMLRANIVVI